jgi:hypothetical protein
MLDFLFIIHDKRRTTEVSELGHFFEVAFYGHRHETRALDDSTV